MEIVPCFSCGCVGSGCVLSLLRVWAMTIEIIIGRTAKTVTKQELFGLVTNGEVSADIGDSSERGSDSERTANISRGGTRIKAHRELQKKFFQLQLNPISRRNEGEHLKTGK